MAYKETQGQKSHGHLRDAEKAYDKIQYHFMIKKKPEKNKEQKELTKTQ